ncbi:MAG: DUF402 domain-containing protein [Thermoproteota archaeon]
MGNAILYYRRPPDRLDIIEVQVLKDTSSFVVLRHTLKVSKPLEVDRRIVIGNGYDAAWFIYRGKYYTIGVIRDLAGSFTGYYCDIILPLVSLDGAYEATDLFLDLWITPDGRAFVLDEDEFKEAVSKGWISSKVAHIAREVMDRMIRAVKEGTFPPKLVRDFVMGKAIDCA